MLVVTIVQLVLAVILVASILMQSKGAGLSSVLGGSGAIYSTKRGVEKMLFYVTIVTAILFFGSHILSLFIS